MAGETKNIDIFPDLHHKMSKKIAQVRILLCVVLVIWNLKTMSMSLIFGS